MKLLNNLKTKNNIYLLLILVGAFILRVVNLTEIPPGLNRDEAAIGYNAYSILKTGRDEYGKLFPISLQSFGDWKLPLYVYASVPVVFLFGLTEFSVRLVSTIAGMITIVLCYLFTKNLYKNTNIALLSVFLLAISPWHIFFSRVTSEANLAVLLVILGAYFIFMTKTKVWSYPIGAVILSLSLLTYHGNHIFTPLLFIIVVFVKRKEFISTNNGKIGILLFVLICGFVYRETLFSADKTKLSGLLSINDISIVHEQIVKNRLIYKNEIIGKLLNNKILFLVENIAQNYVKAFSPEFLFIGGGTNAQHNIPDFGNLYLIEAPFLLAGLFYLTKNVQKEKYNTLLILWILISPIGASLTKDAPHSARMFAIFPALSIVIAYGIIHLLEIFKNKNVRLLIAVFVAVTIILNFSIFIGKYFVLFPYKSYMSWGKAYKELVEKVSVYKLKYTATFIAKPENSPYIYYLFYQKSDPRFVQNNLLRYPPTDEGFTHVMKFDNINYQKINWTDELLIPDRLYIDWTQNIPTGATQSAIILAKGELARINNIGISTSQFKVGDIVQSKEIDSIFLPDGTKFISFIETRLSTKSSSFINN